MPCGCRPYGNLTLLICCLQVKEPGPRKTADGRITYSNEFLLSLRAQCKSLPPFVEPATLSALFSKQSTTNNGTGRSCQLTLLCGLNSVSLSIIFNSLQNVEIGRVETEDHHHRPEDVAHPDRTQGMLVSTLTLGSVESLFLLIHTEAVVLLHLA